MCEEKGRDGGFADEWRAPMVLWGLERMLSPNAERDFSLGTGAGSRLWDADRGRWPW